MGSLPWFHTYIMYDNGQHTLNIDEQGRPSHWYFFAAYMQKNLLGVPEQHTFDEILGGECPTSKHSGGKYQ
jgi:hypothetical protein